jgi:protocatechuate 3,4-dioxygenase beta subunit
VKSGTESYFAILASLILLVVTRPPTQAFQSLSSIEGIVVDAETTLPMEHVKVSLLPEAAMDVPRPTASKVVETDAQGRFSIEYLTPGRYRVVPSRDGFVALRPSRVKVPSVPGVWVEVAENESVRGIQFQMAKEGVLAGRVLDSRGAPLTNSNNFTLVRGAYNAYGKLTWDGALRPFSSSSTSPDDRGEYRFFGLQPGDYYVRVVNRTLAFLYYPGTPDPAQAAPIHVAAGEEVRLPTMTLPDVKPVNIRLTFPQPPAGGLPSTGRQISLGPDILVGVGRQDPGEIRMPFMTAGHYDVVVRDGSFFSRFDLAVGESEIERKIDFYPGSAVTFRFTSEDASGTRSPANSEIGCRLRSDFAIFTANCNSLASLTANALPHGRYWLELQGPPSDTAVLAATSGGRDILQEGFEFQGDAEIEIVTTPLGGSIHGVVTDQDGTRLSEAVVALVPDPPLRAAGPLYRASQTDVNGKFTLRGISPGSYRLFAWSELDGAAYRNAEFMKDFEDRGTPVRIEKSQRLSLDITAF